MSRYFLITKDFILFDKDILKIKECGSNNDNRKIVKYLLLEDLVNEPVINKNFFFKELCDIHIELKNKNTNFIYNQKILAFLHIVSLFNTDINKYNTLIQYYKEKVSVGLMIL